MRRRQVSQMLAAAGLLAPAGLGSRTAAAQEGWPAKPVHIIVPFPSGGGTDVSQRFYANRLTALLGQTVVVENVGGASGAIGGQRVARSAADGYTFLGTVVTSATLLPHQQKLAYDPIGDFTPVARLAETVGYIAIHKNTGITSLRELIEKAKAAPGKYRYASAGVGSILELRMEELNHAAGIVLEHIPYQGGSAYLSDFIAGRIDLIADGSIAKPQAEKGVATIIATFGETRTAEYPDVPSIRELVPTYQAPSSWQIYLAPKGTPQPVVDRLRAEIRRISQEPETAKFLNNLSMVPLADPPGYDLGAALRDSYDNFAKATARLGLKK